MNIKWDAMHLSESYIIGADKPRNIGTGDDLSIHVTPKLRLTPAVVNVHHCHHVPLKKMTSIRWWTMKINERF